MATQTLSNPKCLLCIDPGPKSSGFVVYDEARLEIVEHDSNANNHELVMQIKAKAPGVDVLIIEMVGCFGMPVGADIFETIRWIGIFQQAFGISRSILHYRKDVKLSLCGNFSAGDSNVRAAVLSRFPQTGGGKTPAIGIKKNKGPLYGVKSHAMSAVALAVSWRDFFHSEKPWTRKLR